MRSILLLKLQGGQGRAWTDNMQDADHKAALLPKKEPPCNHKSLLQEFIDFVTTSRAVLIAYLVRLYIILVEPKIVKWCLLQPMMNTLTTSIDYLLESKYLVNQGVDIYRHGIILPAPLSIVVLGAFQWLFGRSHLALQLLFIFVDFLIGFCLFAILRKTKINEQKVQERTEDSLPTQFTTKEIMFLYLGNPVTIACTLGMNRFMFVILGALGAIACAQRGFENAAVLLTAIIGYLDMWTVALIAPVTALLAETKNIPFPVVLKKNLTKFGTMLLCLLLTSSLYLSLQLHTERPFAFLVSTYISRLRVDDLRPNIGLAWCLFSQVFAPFRTIFLLTFQLLSFVYWIPATLKFASDPLFLAFVLTCTTSIVKPYPSAADLLFYLLLFLISTNNSSLLNHIKILPLLPLAIIFLSVMLSMTWTYWIDYGGFNVNYFYGMNIGWSVSQIVFLVDVLRSYFNRKMITDNPDQLNDSSVIFQR